MASSSEGDMLQAGQIIREKWKVGIKLGGGGFGEIFEAIDIASNDLVAVKVESSKAIKQVLKMEVAVLRRLQGKKHACQFYGCGRNDRFNYLVMSCQGKNLADLRRESPGQCFSLSTSVRLSLQILKAIGEIHSIGFLHRDIKPSNFAIGRISSTCRTVYMLDFGLARQYLNAKGEIRSARAAAGFRGTVRYASITAHKNKEMGRQDDLWSLLYMLVEFIQGSLPWRKVKDKDEVGRIKQEISSGKLLEGLPDELHDFVEHIASLTYTDAPNYDFLESCLKQILHSRNAQMDDPYDWEIGYENMTKNRVCATVIKSSKVLTTTTKETCVKESVYALNDNARLVADDESNSPKLKAHQRSLRNESSTKPKYKRPDFLRPKVNALDYDVIGTVNARLAVLDQTESQRVTAGMVKASQNESPSQPLKVKDADDGAEEFTFDTKLSSDKASRPKQLNRRKRPGSSGKPTTDVSQTNAMADDDGISSHHRLAGITIISKWQGSFDESIDDDDIPLVDVKNCTDNSAQLMPYHDNGHSKRSVLNENSHQKSKPMPKEVASPSKVDSKIDVGSKITQSKSKGATKLSPNEMPVSPVSPTIDASAKLQKTPQTPTTQVINSTTTSTNVAATRNNVPLSTTRSDSGFLSHVRSIRSSLQDLFPYSNSSGLKVSGASPNSLGTSQSNEANAKFSSSCLDNKRYSQLNGSDSKELRQRLSECDLDCKRAESTDRRIQVKEDDKELRRLRRYRRRSDCSSFRELVQKMNTEITHGEASQEASLPTHMALKTTPRNYGEISSSVLRRTTTTAKSWQTPSPRTLSTNNNTNCDVAKVVDMDNNEFISAISPVPPSYAPKTKLLPSRLRKYQSYSIESTVMQK